MINITLEKAAEAIINSYEYARTNEERQTMLETEQPFWNDVTKAATNAILNGEEVMGLIQAAQDYFAVIAAYEQFGITANKRQAMYNLKEALTAINKLKAEVAK